MARLYGYREMATPIFEFTEVFARGIGETTDVVTKEMYTFEDRGGEQLTLRPEYTAGVCRASFIQRRAHAAAAAEVFYAGPMFRYERPQKGRQRQFHQIDLELLGVPEPGADVEVISVGGRHPRATWASSIAACSSSTPWAIPKAATAYRDVLVGYFTGHGTSSPTISRDAAASAIRCASSTARTRATKAMVANAPLLRRTPEPGEP